MREIRFRAWDKTKKIMYTPGDMKSQLRGSMDIVMQIHDGCLWDKKDFDSFYYANNLILMQYTGLKDKNGKEIYEGDIAKIAAFPNDEIIIGEIKYFPDVMWFGFEFDEQEHLNFLDINSTKGIEIIGNIYENPELLKEPTP